MARNDYVRRETAVAVSFNVAISLFFYLLVFWGQDPVPMWGRGNWVFDFVPQTFMVALMSALIPSLLAGKNVRNGKVAADGPPSSLPRNPLVRALLFAFVTTAIGMALIYSLVVISEAEGISLFAGGAIKAIWGVVLGIIITPLALRPALAAR